MTYPEAEAKKLTMQQFSGYHIVIKQANHSNENTYYLDYVVNNPMMQKESTFMLRCDHFDKDFFFSNLWAGVNAGTPPIGRSEEQHTRIQAFNKQSFKRR